MNHLQVGADGKLKHLLTLEGLSREMIHRILDNAASFLNVSDRDVKKVPLLRGRSVFNLFFENSTRTRTTFEIAATRLSADIVNPQTTRLVTLFCVPADTATKLTDPATGTIRAVSDPTAGFPTVP